MSLHKLYKSHILSIDQFDRELLSELFKEAHYVETRMKTYKEDSDLFKGLTLTNLFYEPSTRTSSSFYAAMAKHGGSVIPINEVKYSSVVKGETLEDTIRTLGCYSDVIVLRHSEKGAAERAAKVSNVPIINAGDGAGEHPTQTLLDLYTMSRYNIHQQIDGLTITMVGDLKYGRTVHSLTKSLRQYDVKINFVSDSSLSMPDYLVADKDGIFNYLSPEILKETDVLYMTRTQLERHENISDINPIKINKAYFDQYAKPTCIIMHPLPRVDEINTDLDSDPRAVYFRQMENGLYMRMALLRNILFKRYDFIQLEPSTSAIYKR